MQCACMSVHYVGMNVHKNALGRHIRAMCMREHALGTGGIHVHLICINVHWVGINVR